MCVRDHLDHHMETTKVWARYQQGHVQNGLQVYQMLQNIFRKHLGNQRKSIKRTKCIVKYQLNLK